MEANGALVASCAAMISDKMRISTKTKRVKKAREGVLEYLLVNHPLDCPVCDQAAECDLQEILFIFGSDRGRFYELKKKAVTNLNCAGPFIKTVMTRCIHCTRCVRFVNEVSSVFDLGVIGRGFFMEIGTYVENFIDNELLANVIDLCPVGAPISMPSSFTGRNWEIKYIQCCDVLDSLATNLNIGVAVNRVLRVLPHVDEYFDEWITNKARFVYDSYSIQRLWYPKYKLNYKFITCSWPFSLESYCLLLRKFQKNHLEIICGPFMSLELALSAKYFFNSLGSHYINYFEKTFLSSDFRSSFLLNGTLRKMKYTSEFFLLGSNLRLELPLMNSLLRKYYLNDLNFRAYSLGLGLNYLTYPLINLGSSVKNFFKILKGKSLVNKFFLLNDYNHLNYFTPYDQLLLNFFLGSAILLRNDQQALFNSLKTLGQYFHFNNQRLNVVSRHLGRISGLELNLFQSTSKKIKKNKWKNLSLFLGVDLKDIKLKKNSVNVLIGSFFSTELDSKSLNLILPSLIYVELVSSYINLEGYFRKTNKIISSYKTVFIDRLIVYSFMILLKKFFKYSFSKIYDFSYFIKFFKKNYLKTPNFLLKLRKDISNYHLNFYLKQYYNSLEHRDFYSYKLSNSLFSRKIFNYYNSDYFSTFSKVLSLMALKVNQKRFI